MRKFEWSAKLAYSGLCGLFGVLLAGLVALMATDFRPQPVYPEWVVEEGRRMVLQDGSVSESLELTFEAPGDNLNGIYWGEFFSSSRQQVAVSLLNVTRQLEVGKAVIDQDHLVSHFAEGDNVQGDRLCIELRWLADLAPRVRLVPEGDARGSEMRVDGALQGKRAAIRLTREKPSKLVDSADPAATDTIAEGGVDAEYFELQRDQVVEIVLSVPEDGLRVISIPGLLVDERAKVRIEVRNLTSGKQLAKSVAKNAEPWEKTIETPAAGDQLHLTLTRDPVSPPGLLLAGLPARIPIQTVGSVVGDSASPLLLALYRWRSRGLLWLWPLAAVLLFVALYRPRWIPVFLLFLGLAASATAMLCWQQNYSVFAAHSDPDHHGAFAAKLAGYLTGGGQDDRVALAPWFHEYSNAYVPLVSAAVALLHLCGAPVPLAYLWLSGMCAFACLLVVYHGCRRFLNVSVVATLLAVALLGCHLVVLKSFARPSVDMAGLLLTALMLHGVLWRMRESRKWQTFWLAVLPLLLLLARPGTIVYLPFYAVAVAAADWGRESCWSFPQRIRTMLIITLPATLVYSLMFFGFGWIHNLEQAMEKNANDTRFHSLEDFSVVMVVIVQFFLVGWLLLPGELRRSKGWRAAGALSMTWIFYYIGFLLLVEASFVQRLFVPLLPALATGFALGINRFACQRPKMAAGLVLVFCAGNVLVAAYIIHLPFLPPVEFSRFIY